MTKEIDMAERIEVIAEIREELKDSVWAGKKQVLDLCDIIDSLWRMVNIPDLLKDGFLAVGQELINRDKRIEELDANNKRLNEVIADNVIYDIKKLREHVKQQAERIAELLQAENKRRKERMAELAQKRAADIFDLLQRMQIACPVACRTAIYMDSEDGSKILLRWDMMVRDKQPSFHHLREYRSDEFDKVVWDYEFRAAAAAMRDMMDELEPTDDSE
jgi:hypothetical protein